MNVLRVIVWINPCKRDHTLDETVIDWLQNGAELEKKRLLGFRKENMND